MKIVIPKETFPGEKRVPMIPSDVAKLIKRGAQVEIEAGMGMGSNYTDQDYIQSGASVSADRKSMIASAEIVLRLRKPAAEEIGWLKKNTIHVSYLDPFNEKDLVKKLADGGIHSVCMEMIPRSTRAQKMDALSSQASLAGYVAVILAAERLNKIFPMMMTPAGTINPSRVFIIGAGVAGLQAIATAKRLGARVDAFDTRPVVAEQVRSLGAKFVEVDLGETGQTKDGYARELTPEQLAKQREAMAKQCGLSDVVITTAQVFGRKAPIIITKDMIARMKPGSIIVDLAIEGGGNVEGAEPGKEIDFNGVKVLGIQNLPGKVAVHASQMYSSNLTSLLLEFWDDASKSFKLDPNDDILKSALATYDGQIFSETLKNIFK